MYTIIVHCCLLMLFTLKLNFVLNYCWTIRKLNFKVDDTIVQQCTWIIYPIRISPALSSSMCLLEILGHTLSRNIRLCMAPFGVESIFPNTFILTNMKLLRTVRSLPLSTSTGVECTSYFTSRTALIMRWFSKTCFSIALLLTFVTKVNKKVSSWPEAS